MLSLNSDVATCQSATSQRCSRAECVAGGQTDECIAIAIGSFSLDPLAHVAALRIGLGRACIAVGRVGTDLGDPLDGRRAGEWNQRGNPAV